MQFYKPLRVSRIINASLNLILCAMKMISSILSFFLMILLSSSLFAQSDRYRPVLDTGTVEEQFEVIVEKPSDYQEYKVIKKSFLSKFSKNINDSIDLAKKQIASDKNLLAQKNNSIDTLQSKLSDTEAELQEAIRTKNSLSFLGIQMDKTYYNSLMWTIVLILAAGLTMVALLFKRSNAVTMKTKNELEELKQDFDEYRNKTRINKEQLVVKHHDEVKKLKEQLMKQKSGSKY